MLGPVVIGDDRTTSGITTAKHRALVEALAIGLGRFVSTGELVDALWGDDPPASAPKTLQGYVSALRREFGRDLIDTGDGGYRLGDAVAAIDVAEFEREIVAGQDALGRDDPGDARQSFVTALALWRGSPLDDLADGPVRSGNRARLDELRLLAIEGLIDAELALGHHRELVPDLEQLVVDHPYREQLWRSLMLALYRAGRPAEASAAMARLRSLLRDELGLEPSAQTADLERAVLTHDPALDPPGEIAPTNLVAPLDSFVGRSEETRRTAELFDEHRVVMLLGVGGVGKSRLANEVGRALIDRFAGGVWWVDLAAIDGDVRLFDVVADAMDIPVAVSAESAVLARLRHAPALLVLDNCEHTTDAVGEFITSVTSRAPGVRVLATSRTALDVPGARRIDVEPLDVAAPGVTSAAATLFRDRVAERFGYAPEHHDAVSEIVRLVGGLPLGIELAAAQCATESVDSLAIRLRDRTTLLAMTDWAHDDGRHATLGGVLADTVAMLDDEAAAVVPRLAIVPGDFDAGLAAAVLGPSVAHPERVLAVAADASLLSRVRPLGSRPRFRMLWPIREHLRAHLSDADRRDTERRHAEQLGSFGARFLAVADTPGEQTWLARAAADHHHVRAALDWFGRHDPSGGLALAPGLGCAIRLRGDQVEGRDVLRGMLAAAPDAPSRLVAWTEAELAWLEFLAGDVEDALTHITDAIGRFEALDDATGLARALRSHAHALHLGGVAVGVTTPIYERAIEVARRAELPYSVAVSQVQFAHSLTAFEVTGPVDVEVMLDAACDVLREHVDHGHLAHAQVARSLLAFARNDIDAGAAAGEEMLRLSRLARAVIWEHVAHVVLGLSAHERHDDDARGTHLGTSIRLAVETDNRPQLGISLHALAACLASTEPETSARLWGAGGARTPLWPVHERRYGAWLETARAELGDRFEQLVERGAGLATDDAVELALAHC